MNKIKHILTSLMLMLMTLAVLPTILPIQYVSAANPAPDVSGDCASTSTSTSCNVVLTTTATNDIFLSFMLDVGTSASTCPAPTDTIGLTWTIRHSFIINNICVAEERWATWTGSGAITITGHFASHSASFDTFGVVSVKNGFPANPFTNANPCHKNINLNATSVSCNASESANDLAIGMLVCDGGATSTCETAPTVGSGFTSLYANAFGTSCTSNNCVGNYAEDKSETGSGTQAIGYSGLSSLRTYYIIGDVIFSGAYLHSLTETYKYSQTLTSVKLTNSLDITNTYTQTLTSVGITNTLPETLSYSQTLNTVSQSIGLSNTYYYTQSVNQGFDGHCSPCNGTIVTTQTTITQTTTTKTGGTNIYDSNWNWLIPFGLLATGALFAIIASKKKGIINE